MPAGRTAGRKSDRIGPISPIGQFELPTAALERPKRKAPFYPYVYMIWALTVGASLVAIIGAAAWGQENPTDPVASLALDPGRTAIVGLTVAMWGHSVWWVWQTWQTRCSPIVKLAAIAVMVASIAGLGVSIAIAGGTAGGEVRELLTATIALLIVSSISIAGSALHYLSYTARLSVRRLCALLIAASVAALIAVFVTAIVQKATFEPLLAAFATSSTVLLCFSIVYGLWLFVLTPKAKKKGTEALSDD